jgi:methyl-accepting chemotaxis protein
LTSKPRTKSAKLALVIDQMIDGLASMVTEIRSNSSALSASAQELGDASLQLEAASQLTASGASAATAAARQINTSVQTVSNATGGLTETIMAIAHSAADAATVANTAERLAASTHNTMSKLSESSTQIGKVIKVITSIAEQTNLLALNATIEAARAGQAGKGFAVVANEVKELAKETAKATEDISQRVHSIQQDAAGTVGAINEITSVVGRISDIQNTISGSIEEHTAATNQIARNLQETEGTAEIASNIDGLAKGATETRNSAARTQQSAQQLSKLAEQLDSLVGRFNLRAPDGAMVARNGAAH